MHTCDQKPVGRDHIKHAPTRCFSSLGIGIESHADFRAGGLHFRHMDNIAPDQKLILARCDQIAGMPRRMAMKGHGGHAWKHFTLLEQPPAILVRQHLFAPGLEKQLLLPIRAFRHRAIIKPMLWFVFMHDQFSIGVMRQASGHIREASRMIWVHMRQHHHFDIGGINAKRLQIGQDLAGTWLHVIAAACFDQGKPPCRPDQEGIDRGATCGSEICRQDLARFIFGDVAQNIQIAIKEAIADGGDNDLANAVVINTRDLKCWRVLHNEKFPVAAAVQSRCLAEHQPMFSAGESLWKGASCGNILSQPVGHGRQFSTLNTGLVSSEGFEPSTYRLKVRCSTS